MSAERPAEAESGLGEGERAKPGPRPARSRSEARPLSARPPGSQQKIGMMSLRGSERYGFTSPVTGSERIFRILLERILAGDLQPGEKLKETELAEQLGTSRGPLREAMRKLESRHVLVSTPNAGAKVIDLGRKELIDLYLVREALEGMAARLTATEHTQNEIVALRKLMRNHEKILAADGDISFFTSGLDTDFHYQVIKASHNGFLVETLIAHLYNPVLMFRQMFTTKERSRIAIKQHRGILEAIETRDGELAEVLMRRHISSNRKNIGKLMKSTNRKANA